MGSVEQEEEVPERRQPIGEAASIFHLPADPQDLLAETKAVVRAICFQ